MTVIRNRNDPNRSTIPEINARPPLAKTTEIERALATQYVAREARDEQDCAMLLDMLGLGAP